MKDEEFKPDRHDQSRAVLARESYIRWRMNDVPAIYLAIMPTTSDLKALWEAEKCVRQQIADDQRLLASPWRKVGEGASVFDWQRMTAQDNIAFGMEISVEAGMPDAVKPGFGDHPEVVKAREAAKESPERARAMN